MADYHTLKLTIARVDGPVFDGEVISVAVPGVSGAMEILAHHQALISPLRAGTITYVSVDGTKVEVVITSGTIEISNNHATILL